MTDKEEAKRRAAIIMSLKEGYKQKVTMTAVEWLLNQLGLEELLVPTDIVEQAKEMENEKQEYFFECGRNFQLTGEGTFQEVYNETFKSE